MSLPIKQALLEQLSAIYKKNQDKAAMQIEAAKVLRKYAIAYLESGCGPTAVGFRGTIKHDNLRGAYRNFLENQSRNGAWATYIEASALAELLDVNLVVTAVNSEGTKNMFALHRAESDKAPTVDLRNITNSHWDYQGKAIGDGNCLYNAFALAHCDLVQPRKAVAAKAEKSNVWQAIKLQAALLDKFPKPSERLAVIEKEQTRIAKLSPTEQTQIETDRQYALKLACDEVQKPSSPIKDITSKSRVAEPVADHFVSFQP